MAQRRCVLAKVTTTASAARNAAPGVTGFLREPLEHLIGSIRVFPQRRLYSLRAALRSREATEFYDGRGLLTLSLYLC